MTIITLVRTVRPPFLLLTLACVFLGFSAAQGPGAPHLERLVPLILGALAAHIAVNTFNEYRDFRTGLDLATKRTPFSGGSGALPENPQKAGAVLALAMAALGAAAASALYLTWAVGPALPVLGLVGAFLILAYTDWLNKNPLLCLVAPGTGFGLMTVGSQLVLSGAIDGTGWLSGLVVFCLVNNLLLLNQFPDVRADEAAGRRHWLIAFGPANACRIYGLFVAMTALTLVVGAGAGLFPLSALIALAPLSATVAAFDGARRHGPDLGRAPHYLALNVAACLLTPTVLGAALLAP